MDPQPIIDSFKTEFEGIPFIFRSPGRINLIGEHTDYNDGFVLPAAIDKEVVFAIHPNGTGEIRLYAHDLQEKFSTQLDELKKSRKGWPNYIMGVVDQLQRKGHKMEGFDCVFGSDIPIGAGLSSSAAIECCIAYGLNEIFNLEETPFDLVKIGLKAENEFVGLNCGIMDQFTSVFGKEDKVFRLDCRSLDYEYYPFKQDGISIVLVDTCIKHSLASSEYNTRRMECEAGVDVLKKYDKNINSLRDITTDLLEAHRQELNEVVYKRCTYVINEIERVILACRDLENNDLNAFGEKMYETHDGLSQDYEVSCPELDFLVDITRDNPEVLGSRMMGGGFGGCTINIVTEKHVKTFIENTTEAYSRKFWKEPKTYLVSIREGTSRIM